MLAVERRGAPYTGPHPRELHGRADHRNVAQTRMVGAFDHRACGGLGVLHHLIDGVHRRRRHAGLLQHGQQRFTVVPADRGFQRGLQVLAVLDPFRVALETRILGQGGETQRRRQPLPQPVVGGGDEDPLAVLAAEITIRHHGRMRRAERLRQRPRQEKALRVIVEQSHRRLEQRGIDPLAKPGARAVMDGAHDAEGREDSRGEVEERDTAANGRPSGLAGDRHDPAEGLHERLVAGAVLARPRAPEGRDRAVHEPGVQRGERVVAEPERFHGAGPEILDEDVGARDEALEGLDALGLLEIERDVALVAVDDEEGRGLPVLVGRPRARLVAAPGVLHLDDVGAEVGEEHGAEGTGQDTGAIDDTDAFEGQGRLGHAPKITELPDPDHLEIHARSGFALPAVGRDEWRSST